MHTRTHNHNLTTLLQSNEALDINKKVQSVELGFFCLYLSASLQSVAFWLEKLLDDGFYNVLQSLPKLWFRHSDVDVKVMWT